MQMKWKPVSAKQGAKVVEKTMTKGGKLTRRAELPAKEFHLSQ